MARRMWHDEHGTNGTGFELPGTFFCAARTVVNDQHMSGACEEAPSAIFRDVSCIMYHRVTVGHLRMSDVTLF